MPEPTPTGEIVSPTEYVWRCIERWKRVMILRQQINDSLAATRQVPPVAAATFQREFDQWKVAAQYLPTAAAAMGITVPKLDAVLTVGDRSHGNDFGLAVLAELQTLFAAAMERQQPAAQAAEPPKRQPSIENEPAPAIENAVNRSRGGRPKGAAASDAAEDARIYDQWISVRESKGNIKFADFARDTGRDAEEVRAAVERERKRRK